MIYTKNAIIHMIVTNMVDDVNFSILRALADLETENIYLNSKPNLIVFFYFLLVLPKTTLFIFLLTADELLSNLYESVEIVNRNFFIFEGSFSKS